MLLQTNFLTHACMFLDAKGNKTGEFTQCIGVLIFGVFCEKGAGALIPNNSRGRFMREVYTPPEIEPPFDDFKSFRKFLLQNMESKELTMIQKKCLINKYFYDPKSHENVHGPDGMICRFKKGFSELIRYENPPVYSQRF